MANPVCIVCGRDIYGFPKWQIYWDDRKIRLYFCSSGCRAKWLLKKGDSIQIKQHMKSSENSEALHSPFMLSGSKK